MHNYRNNHNMSIECKGIGIKIKQLLIYLVEIIFNVNYIQ